MSSRPRIWWAAGAFVPLAVLLGCGAKSPTAPGRPPDQPVPTPSATLGLATVYPRVGSIVGGTPLVISGFGFRSGATVSLGDVPATVTGNEGFRMLVKSPAHATGTVDIVVTNPDGTSAQLPKAFAYGIFELTVSANEVEPGGSVSVSWVGLRNGALDWIGLFKVGDPNTKYGDYEYTELETTGTFTFTAPLQPGQYEFRYLLDDGFIDVARSSVIRVR